HNVLDKMIPLKPDGIFNEHCIFLRIRPEVQDA
ncbi:hypothetical protein LCGC14_1834770, partial [marine sediment metagenome]